MLTKRDLSRYDLALDVAKASELRYKIGAVIYRGKTRISLATNVLKSHPEHAKRYGPHVISIHAEHRALLLARTSVEGATIYIARYGGRGIAKPCDNCRTYLLESGIAYMVYYNGVQIVKERIRP